MFEKTFGAVNHSIRALQGRLWKSVDSTRLYHWPVDGDLRLGALASAGDMAHIEGFLDAAESYHPGSTVSIATVGAMDQALALSLSKAYPKLAEVRFGTLDDLRGDKELEVLVLLHPWPWMDEKSVQHLKPLRNAFTKSAIAEKWLLYRNMELWKGNLAAKATRLALQPVVKRLNRWTNRRENQALERIVYPRLPQALDWAKERPCGHSNAIPLVAATRNIQFCPECGMGLSPLPPLDDSLNHDGGLYGPGYARSYRYTGDREWLRWAAECRERVEGYLDALGFPKNELDRGDGCVLDYGCGNGRYAPLWLQRGWRYLGVDISQANIDHAQKHCGKGPNGAWAHRAGFVAGELEHPETEKSQPFQVVFLSHLLEHVPEPEKLLAHLRQRTAPQGWLYAEVPNAEFYTWSRQHRGFLNMEHIWDFTPAMLRATATAAGWSDVRIHVDPDKEQNPFFAILAKNG